MTKTIALPLMQQASWVGWVVIGINVLVGMGLAVFGAPIWVVLGDGILCLLMLALHCWFLIRKPEQRLILQEDSLTFVGIWGETTLRFADILRAELGPDSRVDSNTPVLTLSDGNGRSIQIHHGFIRLPEGVVPLIEARLNAHGKKLERRDKW